MLGARNISGPPNAGRISSGSLTYPTYSGGYAYIAVFDMLYSAYAGSIPVGTKYALGPISSLTTPLPESPPATVFDYGALILPAPNGPLVTSASVVPEPATGLFALAGLGVLAFRRMRQRNG
jgi:MYXO-CTERM domain-containing protein